MNGKRYMYLPEVLMWVTGIILLALMEPNNGHLVSFCLFSYITDWCPGCGLGHAIAWLVRGEVRASWEAHPLGIPAVLLLCWRCIQLLHFQSKYNR